MRDLAWPTGRWAVGVSGGADSVALLLLANDHPNLSLHVVHLDHQTRDGASAGDAEFVADLAGRLGLPATVVARSGVERDPPRNPSARYRAARLTLFRRVVVEQGLEGVLLAHHADDQAETVMLRLLRGGGPRTVTGMAERAVLSPYMVGPPVPPSRPLPSGLVLVRPLLDVPSSALRKQLQERGQPWREDASNTSDLYLRNRIRPWLASDAPLADALRSLAVAARELQAWLHHRTPVLEHRFAVETLSGLPAPLARHAAGRWLVGQGVPADGASRWTCDRLVAMATDAATPHRQTFPGGVSVRRSRGWMAVASWPSLPAR